MTDLPDDEGRGPVETVDPELLSELKPLLRPEKQAKGLQIVATHIQKHHSGPLPPPEDFEHYERVLPGLGERIVTMAEKAQTHRHKQESRVVIGEYAIRLVGQFGALFTIVVLAVLIGFCAYVGQPLAAGVVAAIGGVAGFFLHKDGKKAAAVAPPKAQQPRRKKR